MGVEAREQTFNGNSMEDKQLTRPDHPMAMYAEAFTKNFDLIAERKSVVYHLRELAKASVIAKYLLDSNAQLDESVFNLWEGKEVASPLEVPQLWNERYFSQVEVQDGVVKEDNRLHGVYGGVNFGLDKFGLTSPARTSVSAGLPAAGLSAGITSMPQHRFAFGLSKRAGLAPVSNIMAMASGAQFAPPSATLSAAPVTGAPRLASSIGAPLTTRFTPPSAALSAKVAPRLATSISATASLAAAPRLAATIGAAPKFAASIGTAPRLAASIGTAPRLASSIAASIGTAPRLASSIA